MTCDSGIVDDVLWCMEETIRALPKVATEEFCQSLSDLKNDEKHTAYFDINFFKLLQNIGRTQTLEHVEIDRKVLALATSSGCHEIYVRLTGAHLARVVERADKTVLLRDLVFPGSAGWAAFKSMVDDVRRARIRARAVADDI